MECQFSQGFIVDFVIFKNMLQDNVLMYSIFQKKIRLYHNLKGKTNVGIIIKGIIIK